jgi:signal transduction histidine kinase
MNSIRQAGNGLLAIINNILDFSKIESERMEIVPSEYSLASLLSEVISITSMQLKGGSSTSPVELVTKIDSQLPARLWGDGMRISQALLNILGNAVKYTGKGLITFTVSRQDTGTLAGGTGGSAKLPGGNGTGGSDGSIVNLVFEISDTGPGIKEEDIENLFSDFTRSSGLGLAISYKLCRLMGGDISAKSCSGEGSTFTVTLPQETRDPAPLGELEQKV